MRFVLGLLLVAFVAGCGASEPPPATSVDEGPPVQAFAAPASMTVDRLGVRDQSMIPVGIAAQDNPRDGYKAGEIAVPSVDEPDQLAWYDGSVKPGQTGPSVYLGHVNGGGRPGVFADLKDMEVGDQIWVTDQNGKRFPYSVYRAPITVGKNNFPTSEVYGNTDAPELRLVTCGGSFDEASNSYRDNVIVFATMS